MEIPRAAGRLYVVTELLSGGELFDYVVKRGTLSEAEAAAILADLADAVRFMHDQGIIHRDLKPENLLLEEEPARGAFPAVKIIDFGLSKMLADPTDAASSFLGTRGYLAPEMLKRHAYSRAVDMWAFGVIAYASVRAGNARPLEIRQNSAEPPRRTRPAAARLKEMSHAGAAVRLLAVRRRRGADLVAARVAEIRAPVPVLGAAALAGRQGPPREAAARRPRETRDRVRRLGASVVERRRGAARRDSAVARAAPGPRAVAGDRATKRRARPRGRGGLCDPRARRPAGDPPEELVLSRALLRRFS